MGLAEALPSPGPEVGSPEAAAETWQELTAGLVAVAGGEGPEPAETIAVRRLIPTRFRQTSGGLGQFGFFKKTEVQF